MKTKLSTKLLAIAGFPTLFFLILGGMQLNQTYKEYVYDTKILDGLELLQENTVFLGELMKERGQSALYLNSDNKDRSRLDSQRNVVDEKISLLGKHLEEFSLISRDEKADMLGDMSIISGIRSQVNSDIESNVALREYNKVVDHFLDIYPKFASHIKNRDISARIRSLGILATAMNEAGLLRALSSTILEKNEPVSSSDMQKLLYLRTIQDSNLSSRGLAFEADITSQLKSIKDSSKWRKTSEIFDRIFDRKDEGSFEISGSLAFDAFSQKVSDIGSLIATARLDMKKNLLERMDHEWTEFLSTGVMLLFFAMSLTFVLFYMVRSINSSIGNVIENLYGCANEVNTASGHIMTSSESLSSSANEAASSLEETVSSVEEISSMVKQNADNSRQASSLSQASKESAQRGEQEIDRLIASMREISDSSVEMEKIIKVIDDIAFQTNLLALNAAVEAARAGEQGKGFAVVAEAVRNLAQRSADSASDISELIKDTISKTEKGSDIATKGGKVLSEIVESATKVADLIAEISTASDEQSRGIIQVSQALNELDKVSQGTAHSAEQSASASVEMSNQSSNLMGSVDMLNSIVKGSGKAQLTTAASTSFAAAPVASMKSNVVAMDTKNKGQKASEVIPFDLDGEKDDLNDVSGF